MELAEFAAPPERHITLSFLHSDSTHRKTKLETITQSWPDEFPDDSGPGSSPVRQTLCLPENVKGRAAPRRRWIPLLGIGIILEVGAMVFFVTGAVNSDGAPFSSLGAEEGLRFGDQLYMCGLLMYILNFVYSVNERTFQAVSCTRKEDDNTQALIDGLCNAAPLIGFKGEASHKAIAMKGTKRVFKKMIAWEGFRYFNYGSWLDVSGNTGGFELRSNVLVRAHVQVAFADVETQAAFDSLQKAFRTFLNERDKDVWIRRVEAVHHPKWRLENSEMVLTRGEGQEEKDSFPAWFSVRAYTLAVVLLLGSVFRIFFWTRVDRVTCHIYKVVSAAVLPEEVRDELRQQLTYELSEGATSNVPQGSWLSHRARALTINLTQ